MARRPNIVFILTDDQGYPPLGCHGHPLVQTPHLDRFHGEAVRFEDFHSGTTCAPTRAGLMTGHHCNSTGVWHTLGGRSLLRRNEWSLAEALRGAGYRTALFGKWHLGDEVPYRPQDRGFDLAVCHGGGGIAQQPDWWGNDYFDDTYRVNGAPRRFEGYCTDVFFRLAEEFIDECARTPFFCFVSTNAPHSPFNVAPRYRDLYADKASNENYARFLGMITNIDENFGRLRAHLAARGLEEDTILVFMSDNGQTPVDGSFRGQYNAGMRGLKGSPYEGGHRVPFFMRWPSGGIGGGRAVDALAAYVDFMPTILDLCGIAVPEGRSFHGQSLASLARGESGGSEWTDRVVVTDTQRLAYPVKWRLSCAMRGRWRLIGRDWLYDLVSDPAQRTDVAAAHPEVVADLREAYEAWWELCAEQLDAETPIALGAPGQAVAVLNAHDLRNDLDLGVVWNQGQVRAGEACHGWWEVDVAREGTFEIELRRWPVESGHGVADGIDGRDVEIDLEGLQPGAEDWFEGGRALPIDAAVLDISGLAQQHCALGPDAACASFRVALPEGPRRLRARFTSANGYYASAYYVYVRRLEMGA
ncbi:MAG: arylsulfatase [Alphaproteobacteria bacterium]|nr:arylsulfatase [Alphaproteobacteria bacterium]